MESKFNAKFVNIEINNLGTCVQKLSNVWNKIFENKLIAKDHRIPNILTEYKIFKLKCGNLKLSNVLKYNQLLAVFASSKSTLNHIKQALCN